MLINSFWFVPTTTCDSDAQTFNTNAGITGTTEQSAVCQLVSDLKTYNIWTKMKAIYPFVGGTATTHKYNLKNPLDTDAAFRLVFNGGWTHTVSGATPSGINSFADTKFSPSIHLTTSSAHFSKYNRTLDLAGNKVDGAFDGGSVYFQQNYTLANGLIGDVAAVASYTQTDSRGLFTVSRIATNAQKVFKNSNQVAVNNTNISNIPNKFIYIGARNDAGPVFLNTYQAAFASLGDGLTDADISNLYTAVQKFQTTLGRYVGVPIVSDSDAQAFLNAAVIENLIQANAVNQLVIDLKSYNIWSKMYAIYPFVGGTATTHKFNLKNPLDTNAAYRLTFSGGSSHSNSGVTFNGLNGYGNTFLGINVLPQNSAHLSFYSRTNSNGNFIDIGGYQTSIGFNSVMLARSGGNFVVRLNTNGFVDASQVNANSQGFYQAVRNNSTQLITKKNNNVGVTFTNGSTTAGAFTNSYYLGNANFNGSPLGGYYSNREYAFFSLGEGLTTTEQDNFYTAVQAFQTTLGRQV